MLLTGSTFLADCFQPGPALKGYPRYSYQLTQADTFSRSCLFSAGAEATVFKRGRGAQFLSVLPTKIKVNCAFF